MITLYGCIAILAVSNTGAGSSPKPDTNAQPKVLLEKVRRASRPVTAKPKPVAPKPKAVTPKSSPVNTLMDQVQAYYRNLTDYRADFNQKYTKVALSRTTESRGTLMIRKPGQMRWAYRDPIEKLWLVDGSTLYVVDPEFEQVFIDKNFKTVDLENSIRFLWGKGHLSDTFHATLGDPAKYEANAKLQVLELVPKSGATYTKLVLIVDPKTGEVRESILYETAGNTNRFAFAKAKINPGLDAKLFKYTPPPAWEIIYR